MESIKKPAKLLHHAGSLVQKGCAIVGIKSGATAAGKRAAASHTGAMATSDTAFGALFGIEEIDLNPVKGMGVDLFAVDAMIILNGNGIDGSMVPAQAIIQVTIW